MERTGKFAWTGKSCLVIAALLVSAPVFVAAPIPSDDSAMFRGNPQRTGVYDSPGAPSFTKVKWKFHTHGMVISSPAIANGNAYVGSTDGNLYAVDLETGAQKWKFATQARVTSSPAVVSGTVYFGSYDGNFYALGTDSGKLIWKFKTGDVVHASPAISEGVLFLGSWDTYFYALDATNGKEKWRFKTGEDPNIHNQVGIQSSAAVADGVVYFGCRDSNLYALDARTGQKKWAFNNKGSWVIGSPAVRDGKIYFSTSDSGMFYGADAKTGAQLFSLKFIWPMFSSSAIAGNTLYIGSNEGKLFTIDLTTQKPGWVFQSDGSRKNGAALTNPDGSPNYQAVFPENFYDSMVAGATKMLSVGTILSSPVVAGNAVYFGSTDGNLYALM